MTLHDGDFASRFPPEAQPAVRKLMASGWTRLYAYPELEGKGGTGARGAYRRLFEKLGEVREDIGMVTAMFDQTRPVLAIHSFDPIDERTEAIIAAGIGEGVRMPDSPQFSLTMNQRRIGQMLEAMMTGEAIEIDKTSGKVLRLRRDGIYQQVDSEGRNIP